MAGQYKAVIKELEYILRDFLKDPESDDTCNFTDIPDIVEFILNDTSRFHCKLERIQTILDEEDLDDEV